MPSAQNEICIRCKQRVKRKNYQFCSKRCTDIAAKRAPGLLRVPKGHVMYNDVKKCFAKEWKNRQMRLPTIARMYLITWTPGMRSSFDSYRKWVAKVRKLPKNRHEAKRFRSEARACRLGDPGQTKLCKLPQGRCRLCTALRTGYKYSLQYKRNFVAQRIQNGVRFGGGLYFAPTSSKAYHYAVNDNNRSPYKAVTMGRVVLGVREYLRNENHQKLSPAPGHDSVETRVPGEPAEIVVYNDNAARPAYLIMLK